MRIELVEEAEEEQAQFVGASSDRISDISHPQNYLEDCKKE